MARNFDYIIKPFSLSGGGVSRTRALNQELSSASHWPRAGNLLHSILVEIFQPHFSSSGRALEPCTIYLINYDFSSAPRARGREGKFPRKRLQRGGGTLDNDDGG